jgi:hypothetical protein
MLRFFASAIGALQADGELNIAWSERSPSSRKLAAFGVGELFPVQHCWHPGSIGVQPVRDG